MAVTGSIWPLRGLRGCCGVIRGAYGKVFMYPHASHGDPVSCHEGPRNYNDIVTSRSVRDNCTYVAVTGRLYVKV